MRAFRPSLIVSMLALVGCNAESADSAAEPSVVGAAAEQSAAGEGSAADETPPVEAVAAADESDTFEDGVYRSPAFNVQFTLPDGWRRANDDQGGPAGLGTSDDSITFVFQPPAGHEDPNLRLVVANSSSIQLVDQSFANLTETVGFDNVRIVPDASQARTFNGVPGYRTEADALLRGEAVPVYLIAQALELPGKPTMFTIFVSGDHYFEHSDDMKAILDSIEVLNLRAE